VIARIGGGLVIGGLVGTVASLTLATGSADVLSIELPVPGRAIVLVPVFLALTAVGPLCLTWSFVPFFMGRTVAWGMRCLALGLMTLSGVVLAAGSGGLKGTAVDFLLVPLAGGALATIVGALGTGVALVRQPGPERLVGVILVSGLLLVVLGNWARNGNPPAAVAVTIGSVGLLATFVGGLLVGLLGLISSEPAELSEA
jgi:hypothetical protein